MKTKNKTVWTQESINKLMDISISFKIVGFLGSPRSGKSLGLTEFGIETYMDIQQYIHFSKLKKKLTRAEQNRVELLKKFEIWSNLKLNRKVVGDYRYLSVSEIIEIYQRKEKIKHKILLLDDIFKELDSRNFTKEENKAFSYLTTEVGKNLNILGYVAHFKNMYEMRLRNLTQEFRYSKKGEYVELIYDDKSYKVWVEDDDYFKLDSPRYNDKEKVIRQYITNQNFDFTTDGVLLKESIRKIRDIPANKYYTYFDSFEVIN